MDFLDSLDLDTTNKKSNRVRSWYLYEQYKSLERNQLDAAQKLKSRSYQDRILHQELAERRARRRLYDQFGLCQSESKIEKTISSEDNKTSFSVSTDDFFETFCELHDDKHTKVEHSIVDQDVYSQDDSQADFKSFDDLKDDIENSYAESINSVVENVDANENLCNEIQELDYEKRNIAEEINLQLETVQENLLCLEEYTKMCSDERIYEDDSESSLQCYKEKDDHKSIVTEHENNLFIMWSKLVSFAYQVVQLNHGNCYYDYSSQLLTAVLAFDVLRRGVNRMCNILQPYVSPIKFATDELDACADSGKHFKKKKIVHSVKSRNYIHFKDHPKKIEYKCRCFDKRYHSENIWRHCSKYSFGKSCRGRENRRASEPWRSVARLSTCKREPSNVDTFTSNSMWPEFTKECCCCCHKKTINPMLKLVRRIDSVLSDIDNTKRI